LAISDPFNSSDNQTCTYLHDDLARVGSVNCGSVWPQTFTNDSFGNITKSGSISWQPGYNSATNQYLGSSGSSYDADGNLLSNPFNTYAWDANGQPVTISARAITYDAFGRQVERSTSGTYDWSVIYTPIGRAAYGQGQALNGLVLELPGGARTEAYNGYPQWFQHMDWLGSSRLMSTMATRTVAGTQAYAPYGETYAASGVNGTMFAGTFYDTAPTTYDADARRLNPNQGCWISRDPAGLAAVDPTNPQSWNRYVYVANNPLSFVDPSGLNKQPCPAGAVYGCDWFSLAVLLDPALWFPYLMDTGCYSEGCTYLWGFALFTGGGSCYYALQNPCGGRGNSSREGGSARVSGWLTNRLGACTQTFFGIETRTFVPAVRGVNGTFFGLDSNRNGVSVETNATKFSSTQLAFTAPWTLFGEGVKESLTQTTQASTT